MGIIEKWTRRRGPREHLPPSYLLRLWPEARQAGPSLEGRDVQ